MDHSTSILHCAYVHNQSQQKQSTAATRYNKNNVVIGGSATRWSPRDIKIDSLTEVEMRKVLKYAVLKIGDQSKRTSLQKAMDPKKEKWM